MASEQDIIRDVLAGNPECFRDLVQRYSSDLLRIAYHFVHSWEDARDLTQNTWIRCFQSLRRCDLERPFRPWLYRIHLNVCKAAARRRQRRLSREVRLGVSDADPQTEIGHDDLEPILGAIEQLPLKQKMAFIMSEIEGMNSREAAYVLGCRDSTFRVHLARARQTLRERLTKLGIGYGSIY